MSAPLSHRDRTGLQAVLCTIAFRLDTYDGAPSLRAHAAPA
ncbi:MAG: hypothetical protein ACXWZS_04880 [Gemmatirosa sp.]